MTQTLFGNKRMIAHNLLQNAIDEAKGAARVNIVAEKYANSELLDKMKRHVGDKLIELLQAQQDDGLEKIVLVLKQILSDEIYHVQYTGAQINRWLDENVADRNILLNCFQHTNRETWHDLANMSNYLADHYALLNAPSLK